MDGIMELDIDPYPVLPDGLPLYLKETTYKSETSPLSFSVQWNAGHVGEVSIEPHSALRGF